jgi:hypothetical protein
VKVSLMQGISPSDDTFPQMGERETKKSVRKVSQGVYIDPVTP